MTGIGAGFSGGRGLGFTLQLEQDPAIESGLFLELSDGRCGGWFTCFDITTWQTEVVRESILHQQEFVIHIEYADSTDGFGIGQGRKPCDE